MDICQHVFVYVEVRGQLWGISSLSNFRWVSEINYSRQVGTTSTSFCWVISPTSWHTYFLILYTLHTRSRILIPLGDIPIPWVRTWCKKKSYDQVTQNEGQLSNLDTVSSKTENIETAREISENYCVMNKKILKKTNYLDIY